MATVGSVATILSLQIPVSPRGDAGGQTVPLIAALGLCMLGLLEMLRGASVSRRGSMGAGATQSDNRYLKYVLALLVLCVTYGFLIGAIGYHLSTGLAAVAGMWLFGMRHRLGLLLAALVTPVLYHMIFFVGLAIFPPFGEWFDVYDWLTRR
ncbi:tripartite tricarboxylate transporter TctB family protein [Yoonia sediminilitoris]|uniref:Tripartite tricarboxylate transporter TctB family protein n=2 Tax=Yoonia sediminilitoris TaxID=1286148 RepID=A0A2T6KG76_9RHOB|nr:tripartite tricarboxylate transporter TctB family protein [Yoonia sediminilitoris]RCW95252.1 tripartite tricarboxylate transporter TctB family protein [Yoonia sediminilitoris]